MDRYLSSPNEPINPNEDLDLLDWWKKETHRYPVLSRLARDILAVPALTVASESAFSTGRRVVSDYRSSLSPALVEYSICLRDWFKADQRKQDSIPDTEDGAGISAAEFMNTLHLRK